MGGNKPRTAAPRGEPEDASESARPPAFPPLTFFRLEGCPHRKRKWLEALRPAPASILEARRRRRALRSGSARLLVPRPNEVPARPPPASSFPRPSETALGRCRAARYRRAGGGRGRRDQVGVWGAVAGGAGRNEAGPGPQGSRGDRPRPPRRASWEGPAARPGVWGRPRSCPFPRCGPGLVGVIGWEGVGAVWLLKWHVRNCLNSVAASPVLPAGPARRSPPTRICRPRRQRLRLASLCLRDLVSTGSYPERARRAQSAWCLTARERARRRPVADGGPPCWGLAPAGSGRGGPQSDAVGFGPGGQLGCSRSEEGVRPCWVSRCVWKGFSVEGSAAPEAAV